MDKGALEALIATLDNWAALFTLLVVIGVGGELAVHVMSSRANKKLAALQNIQGLAQEAEIARLRKDSASFELDIAKANEGAADAKARAAGLEVEALQLRKQLTLQGARENLLSGENRQKLVDALKRFAGQKVDVRYSASVMMVNSAVVSSSPLGDDTVGLANALVGFMKDAGWSLPPSALPSSIQGYGINVKIVEMASPLTRAAAEGLAKALRDVSLVVFGPQIVSPERTGRVGKEAQAMSPPLDENTIVLGVLTHPK
jgi:hypothetical protein